MSPRPIVALDTETHPWAVGAMAPKIVSNQTAIRDGDGIACELHSNADEGYSDVFRTLLGRNAGVEVVFQNASYDLACIAAEDPTLIPDIFFALAGSPDLAFEWPTLDVGRISDTKIREKLLNLSTYGSLEWGWGKARLLYDLATLEKNYIGRDRSEEKKGPDAHRNNYGTLDGIPSSEWPLQFQRYAIEDPEGTLVVYEEQEKRLADDERASVATQRFQVACDFALRLITCTGALIDTDRKAEIAAMLERELAPEKHPLCLSMGLLRPAVPPRALGKRMTKGKKESKNLKVIHALIEQVCRENNLDVKLTETGRISADSEVMENVAPLHPALAELKAREELQKLVTTELPRMGDDGIMYPGFDVLKETGRTSSGEIDGVPSGNIQNVDPRARPCYVPPAGHVFYSVDYSALEFCSMAQKCYTLFGFSAMRDLLLAGDDPHAFLGAQMAYALDEGFRDSCPSDDRYEGVYKHFLEHKRGSEKDKKFFKHWRTMAKPVGFGYPGGLGAETLISFAKGSYGVTITLEQAKLFKEIFFESYPEMKLYFRWLETDCKDGDDFTYVTPFGMVRRGASFCAAANGALLQSPAAEGAKLATFEVVRACYDVTYNNGEPSILYGSRVVAFIHDEILGWIREDAFMSERVAEVSRLMIAAMRKVMPDVPIKTEAKLMRRWSKDIEPSFGPDGRLTITEEKQAA